MLVYDMFDILSFDFADAAFLMLKRYFLLMFADDTHATPFDLCPRLMRRDTMRGEAQERKMALCKPALCVTRCAMRTREAHMRALFDNVLRAVERR